MAWLYQRPDSKRWWIGYRINGRQVLKSTGTHNKVEAQKQLDKLNLVYGLAQQGVLTHELFAELTGSAITVMPLRSALKLWRDQPALADATVSIYRQTGDEFSKYIGATDDKPAVRDIEKKHVVGFLDARRRELSASSTNLALACLSAFFDFCETRGFCRENIAAGIPKFAENKAERGERNTRRPITRLEAHALYQVAPDEFWRYMVLAGFYTGLRIRDCAQLKINEIDFDQGLIVRTAAKTGKKVLIPLVDQVLITLQKLVPPSRRKRKDYLWPEQATMDTAALSQQFKDQLLVKTGLAQKRSELKGDGSKRRRTSEVSFHSFRHGYVSGLANSGVNQQTVKAMAGHASTRANDGYTHMEVAALRKAVALLPDITKGGK